MKPDYFIFDVDGTLTPSRSDIQYDYMDIMIKLCSTNKVYLITGSDRIKTLDQLGKMIYYNSQIVFQCNGNDVWTKDTHISTNIDAGILSHELLVLLHMLVSKSDYHTKTGNHIEHRPGMTNFSIVGRNASLDQRKTYIEYDLKCDNRLYLISLLEQKFGKIYDFKIAGETGIDIYKTGKGKEQIAAFFTENTVFFGDSMLPSGNDYWLSRFLPSINVKDDHHTFNIIKEYLNTGIIELETN
tara:strand:- start:162 stop:887 length:726 start_codon:yes stop_codon:yes gene_type:complete